MEELLLWQYRKELVKYICINNYSIAHARRILAGTEHEKPRSRTRTLLRLDALEDEARK
jgi:hypothetical protein